MQIRLIAAMSVLAAALLAAPAAQAQNNPVPHLTTGVTKSLAHNVLCPAPVSVVLTPTAPAAGWQTNNTPVHLTLDAKNPPRVESNTLICYYAMPDGYNAFVYFQALGGRSCTVRSDNTGFVCH